MDLDAPDTPYTDNRLSLFDLFGQLLQKLHFQGFIFNGFFLFFFSFFFFCSLNMLIFTCQLYFSKAGEKHRKIILTQGSNLGLLHCGHVLYCLSHQGSLIKHKAGEKHSIQRCVFLKAYILCTCTHTHECVYT